MLKNKKIFYCVILMFAVLGAGATAEPVNADCPAGNQECLSATTITRITHPAYESGNLWYAVKNPWNVDRTRILIYEVKDTINGVTGRGLRWGFISELKGWTTQQEYETVARAVPDDVHITVLGAAFWSPYADENNILYAPFYSGSNGTYIKKN